MRKPDTARARRISDLATPKQQMAIRRRLTASETTWLLQQEFNEELVVEEITRDAADWLLFLLSSGRITQHVCTH